MRETCELSSENAQIHDLFFYLSEESHTLLSSWYFWAREDSA